MGVNYRCRSCRTRRTLNKPIGQYVREPDCLECGGVLVSTRCDNEYDSRRTCNCNGIEWPHRKGAIVGEYQTCIHASKELLEMKELGVIEGVTCTGECPF